MSSLTNVNNSVPSDFTLVLPPEITREVLSHLPIPDLAKVARVSKQWNTIFEDNQLWLQIGKSLQIPNFTDKECKAQVKAFVSQMVNTEDELISRITNFYKEQNPSNTSFALKYISGSQPKSRLYVIRGAAIDVNRAIALKELFNNSEATITIIGKESADFAESSEGAKIGLDGERGKLLWANNVQDQFINKIEHIFSNEK